MAKIVCVGGGIVGLATAFQLCKNNPEHEVLVLEKEAQVGQHQSGRNSNVLHSGIYYQPGALKARLCRDGAKQMRQFCHEHSLPIKECGKLIIATHEREIPTLEEIYQRGVKNNIKCHLLNAVEIKTQEPNAMGIRAISVPDAAVVSFPKICIAIMEQLKSLGGRVLLNQKVTAIKHHNGGVKISCGLVAHEADFVINCAGLHSDTVAKMSGVSLNTRIVPIRGEYHQVSNKNLVNTLLYPTPDPRLPFLGVHLTVTVDGRIECGPNAIPSLGRESYRWHQFNISELISTASWLGAWKLLGKNFAYLSSEVLRSMSKQKMAKALQKLAPKIRPTELSKIPSGIRAQAVGQDGKLIDDFLWKESPHALHVLNAPSPAATASLAIGNEIRLKALELMGN